MAEAKSLQCNQCGAVLPSVKAAQDHAEATGHADFAESTEKVRRHHPLRWGAGAAAGG